MSHGLVSPAFSVSETFLTAALPRTAALERVQWPRRSGDKLSLQPSAHSIVRVMNACPVPVPSFAESFRTPGHPSTFLLITAAVTLFSLLTLEPVTPSAPPDRLYLPHVRLPWSAGLSDYSSPVSLPWIDLIIRRKEGVIWGLLALGLAGGCRLCADGEGSSPGRPGTCLGGTTSLWGSCHCRFLVL